MDGVLVDVTESYRESIAQTVKHFTGVEVTREQIQDYKNQGGWNDDWKLSHHIIKQAGKEVPFETAKDYFQSHLPRQRRRRPHPARGMGGAPRPARRPQPPIRVRRLHRTSHAPKPRSPGAASPAAWSSIPSSAWTTWRTTSRTRRPARILEANPGRKVYYIGDTVDDARCARAAKVPFIGIAAPSNPRYIDLVFLFQEEGAWAIIDDINVLPEVFAA